MKVFNTALDVIASIVLIIMAAPFLLILPVVVILVLLFTWAGDRVFRS